MKIPAHVKGPRREHPDSDDHQDSTKGQVWIRSDFWDKAPLTCVGRRPPNLSVPIDVVGGAKFEPLVTKSHLRQSSANVHE